LADTTATTGMSVAPSEQPPRDQPTKPRGRDAAAPWHIPWRGWRDVWVRVWQESSRDNLSLIAAGMAFYAMLSLAPALAVIISVYGLVNSPEDLQYQLTVISSYLPAEAQALIEEQLLELVSTRDMRLGWGIAASAGVSLWSSSRAMKSLFGGLNAVYEELETRGWFWLAVQSVGFTLAGLLVLILTILGIPILHSLLEYLPLSDAVAILGQVLSWFLVSSIVLVGLAILYRYGPSRRRAQWRWVSVGALVAWFTWITASAGFSWYVTHFDSYQKTYGALGAVAILLMWFYVSAYAVLIGAELNAELEHQTEIDSTIGPEQPRGKRGAVMADEVGEVPSIRRSAAGKSPGRGPTIATSGGSDL